MILLKSVQEADFFPEETHCQLDSHLVQATTHPRRSDPVQSVGSGEKAGRKLKTIVPPFLPTRLTAPGSPRTATTSRKPSPRAIMQGRSQEETTTEANTRFVVRNQPYEIF